MMGARATDASRQQVILRDGAGEGTGGNEGHSLTHPVFATSDGLPGFVDASHMGRTRGAPVTFEEH